MSNEKGYNNLYPTAYVPQSDGCPNFAPPPYSQTPSAPAVDGNNYPGMAPGQFSSLYGGVPPPPYQQHPTIPSVYPTQPQTKSAYPQQPTTPYYPQSYPVNGTYAPVPQLPPANVSIIVPDGFDASARFDSISRPTIPPPPPGVAPNIAQLAMMSGKNNQVILGQKKRGWF